MVDQVARDSARDAVHAVNNLAQTTGIQIRNVETKIDRLESGLKWAGGLIVSLVLTVLGWAVVQQINANEAQKKEMAQQIELLQQQERARVQARSEILSRLPPAGAAEAALTAP